MAKLIRLLTNQILSVQARTFQRRLNKLCQLLRRVIRRFNDCNLVDDYTNASYRRLISSIDAIFLRRRVSADFAVRLLSFPHARDIAVTARVNGGSTGNVDADLYFNRALSIKRCRPHRPASRFF